MGKVTKSIAEALGEVSLSSWPLCFSKELFRPSLPLVLPNVAKSLFFLICPLLFFPLPETLACTSISINTAPNPSFAMRLECRSAKHFWLHIHLCAIRNPNCCQNQKLLLLIHLVENLTWSNVRLFVVFIYLSLRRYLHVLLQKYQCIW